MTNSPKALYIHIPFCEHICDYCDFTKLQYFTNYAKKYLVSLMEELDSYHIDHELNTIYIGGGTPTSLNDDEFSELLSMLDKYTKGVEEYTVECNPESLSERKLELMKEHGVNRLSIGVESTHDEILKAINRHHTFRDVKLAISRARKAGFNNINVDLIIGLPHVSKSLFIEDLENIISLNVEHISCYSLTVHEHTVFGINHVLEPTEDFSRELYDITHERLEKAGFIHYEVSNWAKPNRMSKHNYTYWKDECYYGVGLGASGYIGKYRYTNTKSLVDYCNGKFVKEKEVVDYEDDKIYFLMLNLRTIEGLDLNKYQRMLDENFYKKHQKTLDKYIEEGLLIFNKEESRIYASYAGMMVLDSIVVELLIE